VGTEAQKTLANLLECAAKSIRCPFLHLKRFATCRLNNIVQYNVLYITCTLTNRMLYGSQRRARYRDRWGNLNRLLPLGIVSGLEGTRDTAGTPAYVHRTCPAEANAQCLQLTKDNLQSGFVRFCPTEALRSSTVRSKRLRQNSGLWKRTDALPSAPKEPHIHSQWCRNRLSISLMLDKTGRTNERRA